MEDTTDIRLALDDEISLLTQISKEAFDTDVNVGGSEVGGPPYYDSEAWHRNMLKSKNLYSIILDEQIVGGSILFHDKKDENGLWNKRNIL